MPLLIGVRAGAGGLLDKDEEALLMQRSEMLSVFPLRRPFIILPPLGVEEEIGLGVRRDGSGAAVEVEGILVAMMAFLCMDNEVTDLVEGSGGFWWFAGAMALKGGCGCADGKSFLFTVGRGGRGGGGGGGGVDSCGEAEGRMIQLGPLEEDLLLIFPSYFVGSFRKELTGTKVAPLLLDRTSGL